MPHSDAIGDGDVVNSRGVAAMFGDTFFGGLGLAVKRDVARCRFVPCGDHAD